MSAQDEQIASDIVTGLEKGWNAADGAAFARRFTDDSDFVNIRGEHFRTRDAIAKGHQGIFDTIYKGSMVGMQLDGVRTIAPSVLLAHVKSVLKVPAGPLAGELRALFSLVLTKDQNEWRIAALHNTLVAVPEGNRPRP